MDDLHFRKAVFAEPFTTDPEVLKAAQNDPKKKRFWDELKTMEMQLQDAMHVPVPENLAEKLILRQSLQSHAKKKSKAPWYLALAASLVFASVLSIGVMNLGHSSLVNDVFAHMDHVEVELMKSAQTDINTINGKLANFNGQVRGDLGEVISANYCYLDKIKSLHMIIRGEKGLISLFVVPDSISESIDKTFNNKTFIGASFLLESAKIIIVGENKEDVESLQKRAQQTMNFTA